MTQKKTHQSKKANGVTKAATVRLANGLTGIPACFSAAIIPVMRPGTVILFKEPTTKGKAGLKHGRT